MASLAALLAVPVTILVVAAGWSGLYGQDAYWYHAFATGELRAAIGEVRAPAPFTWPPGFPMLAALASLFTGPGTASGQAVSLVAGAAVPVLTWLLARELRPWTGWHRPWVAVLAGGLVAVTPHLWQSAAVVMSDTAGLAAMTLGAWGIVCWANGRGLRWAVLAAVAVAFAIDTRQGYAIAGLPLAVLGVVLAVQRGHEAGGRAPWVTLGMPLLAGLAVLAPVVGPMAWAWWRGEPVPFSIQLVSHTWDPANLLRTEIASRDGLGRWTLPMGLFYAMEPARPYHLGPLFGLFAVVGGVRVLGRARLVPAAVLVAWPLLMLGFLGGDVTQNTRYALAVLPPIAILAAGGLDLVVGRLRSVGRGTGRQRRLLLGCLAAVIVGALAVQVAGAWRLTDGFIARFVADDAAIARLAAQVPPDDRLVAFQATLALRHDGRQALELYELTAEDALVLAADGRRTWLLLPASGLDGQWAEASPGRVVEALRAGPGLRLVATAGQWHLWQVP